MDLAILDPALHLHRQRLAVDPDSKPQRIGAVRIEASVPVVLDRKGRNGKADQGSDICREFRGQFT
jgi:hypothetical protein